MDRRVMVSVGATIGVLVACLTGCTSGGGPGASEGSESSGSGVGGGYYAEVQKWSKDLDSCIERKGVPVRDGRPDSSDPADVEAFNAASNECLKELPPAPEMPLEVKQGQAERSQRVVDCLQEKGYDIPDVKVESPELTLPSGVTEMDINECLSAVQN